MSKNLSKCWGYGLWYKKGLDAYCKSGKAERLTKAEGLPKNISIEEFCTKHGVSTSGTFHVHIHNDVTLNN